MAKMTIVDSMLPCRWDWPSSIGSFLLQFGHLEFLVSVYLQNRLPADGFEAVRRKPFDEQVQCAGELFAATPERREAYGQFRQQLDPLRKLRNQIAHGTMHVVLRPDESVPAAGIVQTRDQSACCSRETEMVTLPKLCEQLQALSGALTEFQRLTDADAGWKSQQLD
jgi:hypothetical protein